MMRMAEAVVGEVEAAAEAAAGVELGAAREAAREAAQQAGLDLRLQGSYAHSLQKHENQITIISFIDLRVYVWL